MKRSRINVSRPLPKRKNKTRPGEPTRRAKTNRRNGLAAEAAFKRAHPGAVRAAPGGRADFRWRGRRFEVKYGTARPLDKQMGSTVVRYVRRGGRMVRITAAQSRDLKNQGARKNYKRATRRAR